MLLAASRVFGGNATRGVVSFADFPFHSGRFDFSTFDFSARFNQIPGEAFL